MRIKLEAYQIEPLRKGLQLPLASLFIADDTGLGKTIEAGLVARDLLLPKKVQTIVVSAPPSVLGQWRAELEERFGLLFEILDRQYVARMRRERGFGINPRKTHGRFLFSHNLLTDEAYVAPMRAWLGDRKPACLLILDAAPSSGAGTASRRSSPVLSVIFRGGSSTVCSCPRRHTTGIQAASRHCSNYWTRTVSHVVSRCARAPSRRSWYGVSRRHGKSRDDAGRPKLWLMPPLDRQGAPDPSWTRTLDTLRRPKKREEKVSQWRRMAPIRPVVFEDRGVLSNETVHLHLEQRMVQRLPARFRAQGFVHHDLSRACLAQARGAIPRVILLGRLLLYGSSAERLHEEIIPMTARWIDPSMRTGPLKAFSLQGERNTLRLLEESLEFSRTREPDESVQKTLLASAERDIKELRKQLKPRAKEAANVAQEALLRRGEMERRKLRAILREQRKRVVASLAREIERNEIQQLSHGFKQDDIRPVRANVRSWERRIKEFDKEVETAPERVRSIYDVRARRVEPVGLVYLWPESN